MDLRLLVSSAACWPSRGRVRRHPGRHCVRTGSRRALRGTLPIGTAVALARGCAAHLPTQGGQGPRVGQGHRARGSRATRVVIIEDLITSGGSTVQTAERLRRRR
ncbi:MAG: hypothetical protein R2838_06545 [Caldilineaceae bacterium]